MDAIEEALALARRLPVKAVTTLFERYGKPLAMPGPLFAAALAALSRAKHV